MAFRFTSLCNIFMQLFPYTERRCLRLRMTNIKSNYGLEEPFTGDTFFDYLF